MLGSCHFISEMLMTVRSRIYLAFNGYRPIEQIRFIEICAFTFPWKAHLNPSASITDLDRFWDLRLIFASLMWDKQRWPICKNQCTKRQNLFYKKELKNWTLKKSYTVSYCVVHLSRMEKHILFLWQKRTWLSSDPHNFIT